MTTRGRRGFFWGARSPRRGGSCAAQHGRGGVRNAPRQLCKEREKHRLISVSHTGEATAAGASVTSMKRLKADTLPM